jgi:hypothetical protein
MNPTTVIFVVVNGVPSIGLPVMVGSGQLGKQNTLAVGPLPASNVVQPNISNTNGNGSSHGHSNASIRITVGSTTGSLAAIFTLFCTITTSYFLW